MTETIDIMDKVGSLPILIKYLNDGVEPPINIRTLVLISRYLIGWSGLYHHKPARLTLEGGTLLLQKWLKEEVKK